jgi:hypothetical protein
VLESPPPGAQGHPLWGEYVAYWENRLVELKQGKAVKPPLTWEGYGPMRGLFTRGLEFERTMVQLLQADARLPLADVLVVEQAPPTGQLPRVETFSFKSRDLLPLEKDEWRYSFNENIDLSRVTGRGPARPLLQEFNRTAIRTRT